MARPMIEKTVGIVSRVNELRGRDMRGRSVRGISFRGAAGIRGVELGE